MTKRNILTTILISIFTLATAVVVAQPVLAAEWARLMRGYPQVAIGGIGLEQFGQVRATAVGSIAVVRALVNAEQPEAAAGRLMHALRAGL